jgi:hypothetical protein
MHPERHRLPQGAGWLALAQNLPRTTTSVKGDGSMMRCEFRREIEGLFWGLS